MKYLLTLIQCFIFILFEAFAQNSTLILTLHDSALFTAHVNDIVFDKPSKTMYISNVIPGPAQLKVFKLMQRGNSTISQPVFDGTVNIPQQQEVSAFIDRFNQFRIAETTNLQTNREQNQESSNFQTPGFNIPDPNRIKPYQNPVTTHRGMNNDQFKGQEQLISGINNEATRYETAKNMISLGTYSSHQIAAIIMLMQNERHRIRLADNSQQYAVDPENYGIVFETLRRPYSMRKLNRRLR